MVVDVLPLLIELLIKGRVNPIVVDVVAGGDDEVTFVVSPSAEIYIALRVGAHHVDRLRSFDAHSRAGGQASLNRKPDSVGGFLARNAIGLGKGKVRYLKGVVHLYCQSRIIVAGNLSSVSRLYDDLWESVRLLQ